MKVWVKECETRQIKVKHIFMHSTGKALCVHLLSASHQVLCACVKLFKFLNVQVIEYFLLLSLHEGATTKNGRES